MTDQAHHLVDSDTVTRKRKVVGPDHDLRLPKLRFDLGTLQAVDAGKDLPDLFGDAVHHFLVFAEDFHRKFRLDPFEQLFDPHRDGLRRHELHVGKRPLKVLRHRICQHADFADALFEAQQNFHIVALGGFALFAAPDHRQHGIDLLRIMRKDIALDRFAVGHALRKCRTGNGDDAVHNGFFVELGHKFTPLMRQYPCREHEQHRCRRTDRFGMRKRDVQQRRITAFEHTNQRAVAVTGMPEQQIRQYRHQQQRYRERTEHDEDDIDRHRRIKLARQPAQTQQRNEHGRDNQQREQHRPGDLRRGTGDDVGARRVRFVVHQPKRVFDDDDRTVDDHPDRDRQAAEAHQVGTDAVMPHQQKGDQKRQRQR